MKFKTFYNLLYSHSFKKEFDSKYVLKNDKRYLIRKLCINRDI